MCNNDCRSVLYKLNKKIKNKLFKLENYATISTITCLFPTTKIMKPSTIIRAKHIIMESYSLQVYSLRKT